MQNLDIGQAVALVFDLMGPCALERAARGRHPPVVAVVEPEQGIGVEHRCDEVEIPRALSLLEALQKLEDLLFRNLVRHAADRSTRTAPALIPK